jgi:hypothetical protein
VKRRRSPDDFVGGVEERDLWEQYMVVARSSRGSRRAFVRGVQEAIRGATNNPFGIFRPFKRRAYAIGAVFHDMFFGQFVNGHIRNWSWFVQHHIEQMKVGG